MKELQVSELERIFALIEVEGYPQNLSGQARERFERLLQRVAPLPDSVASDTLTLDGDWFVKRGPLSKNTASAANSEEVLAKAWNSWCSWDIVSQPGKVLYQDPETPPSQRPNWNRVSMAHLDPEDGAMLSQSVAIPASWQGRRILWHCDGVYPAARFYCNGVLLGEHLSGLTPCQWDLTEHVAPGSQAHLCLRLIRRYEASHIDMPRHSMEFAGLTRNTLLMALPDCHVEDIDLPAAIDLNTGTGTIAGSVGLRNTGKGPAEILLRLDLTEPHGAVLPPVQAPSVTLDAGEARSISLSQNIPQAALWSDEAPSCYLAQLTVSVVGKSDVTYRWRVGFRKFEILEGRPYFNGNPIKLRGVNHLTFHPDGGMHTPVPWLRRNLDMMKKANVNCIRTHYAAQPDLLALADEMGFHVLQEIPMDWWGDYVDKPEWLPEAMHRIQGIVVRDRHHPCLLGFCLGNENHPTHPDSVEAFTQQYRVYRQFIASLAPNHLVLVPPPGPANKMPGHFEPRFGDIADVHYHIESIKEYHRTGRVKLFRSWQGPVEEFTRADLTAMGWNGVWFSSEYGIFNNIPDLLNHPYLSAINDHPENPLSGKNSQQAFLERMEREWGYMREDPTCLGGAFFTWIAPQSGSTFGWSLLGEDADWGVLTPDLLPKPTWWALRTLFSPVRFPDRLTVESDPQSITFPISNLFNSFDLAQCTLRTQLETTGRDLGLFRDWRDIPLACPPGQTTEITIPLWHKGARESLKAGKMSVMRFHLLAPDGFRVITADTLLIPREMKAASQPGQAAIGPDAIL